MPDAPKPLTTPPGQETLEQQLSLYVLLTALTAMLLVCGREVLFWTGIDGLSAPVAIAAWTLVGTLFAVLSAIALLRTWAVTKFARIADSTTFKVCFLLGGLASLQLLAESALLRLIPKLFLCALVWLSFHWGLRRLRGWQEGLFRFAGWARELAIRLFAHSALSASPSAPSSARWRAPLSTLAVLLILLLPHEWMVRTHLWTGGFMVEVGADSALEALTEGKDSEDLVIFGSSRAKESIRPRLIEEGCEQIKSPVNRAGHSVTSTDQVRALATELHSKDPSRKSSPAFLVCTVEPLHFTESNVIYIREIRAKSSLDVASFEKVQEANRDLQRWLSEVSGEAVYGTLKSASPTQRRKLPLWTGFFSDAGSGLFADGPAAIPAAYKFNVINRGARWFTRVVFRELGYEGHKLHLSKGATRGGAFAAHLSEYSLYIFPTISDRFFPQYQLDLKTIQEAGTRVLLLRLPIHRDLYSAEESAWPEFNEHMAKIGGDLGISYVDMNVGVAEDFCKDPNSFTDGSHMEHERTEEFHEFLLPVLRRELLEPK